METRRHAPHQNFNQFVIHLGVKAQLRIVVYGRTCGCASNEPGLVPGLSCFRERSGRPNKITMAADQMRAALTIGLAVDDQDRHPPQRIVIDEYPHPSPR